MSKLGWVWLGLLAACAAFWVGVTFFLQWWFLG